MDNIFLTPNQLSEMLGLPRSFIYEHTRAGSKDPLPGFRFGKHLRFRQDELEKWVERHRKR